MASRNISLREEAYERLAAHKREGESFSDVVMRLASERTETDVEEMAGWLDAEHIEEMEETERELNESMERRFGE
jgi:predicted CopG family antitoxin